MTAEFVSDPELTDLVGDLRAASDEAHQWAVVYEMQRRCSALGN